MKKSIDIEKMCSLKTVDEKIKFCQDNKTEFKELCDFFTSVKKSLTADIPDIKGYEIDTFNYKIKVSYVGAHSIKECYKKTVTFK